MILSDVGVLVRDAGERLQKRPKSITTPRDIARGGRDEAGGKNMTTWQRSAWPIRVIFGRHDWARLIMSRAGPRSSPRDGAAPHAARGSGAPAWDAPPGG